MFLIVLREFSWRARCDIHSRLLLSRDLIHVSEITTGTGSAKIVTNAELIKILFSLNISASEITGPFNYSVNRVWGPFSNKKKGKKNDRQFLTLEIFFLLS